MTGQGLIEEQYQRWGSRKHQLMKGFLNRHEDCYKIDSYYTDFFG